MTDDKDESNVGPVEPVESTELTDDETEQVAGGGYPTGGVPPDVSFDKWRKN